jgi:hypothetical protein
MTVYLWFLVSNTFFSWGLFIFVEAVEMSRQIVFAICRVAAKWTGVDSATQF